MAIDLDQIYKSRIGESHEAALAAIYEAGIAAGREYAKAYNQEFDLVKEHPKQLRLFPELEYPTAAFEPTFFPATVIQEPSP